MVIEHYSFGRITADGKTYPSDVNYLSGKG
jgi:hypothetical protein